MSLRQRIDGFRFAPQLLETLAAQNSRIGELEAERSRLARRSRKSRGVVVTTTGGQDEYPDGDSWDIQAWYSTEEAWLHVHGVSGERIASYAPKTFARIEHGKLADITEKTEEATA